MYENLNCIFFKDGDDTDNKIMFLKVLLPKIQKLQCRYASKVLVKKWDENKVE